MTYSQHQLPVLQHSRAQTVRAWRSVSALSEHQAVFPDFPFLAPLSASPEAIDDQYDRTR
jgi:hypothetical protein